jgi:hypothetical protein
MLTGRSSTPMPSPPPAPSPGPVSSPPCRPGRGHGPMMRIDAFGMRATCTIRSKPVGASLDDLQTLFDIACSNIRTESTFLACILGPGEHSARRTMVPCIDFRRLMHTGWAMRWIVFTENLFSRSNYTGIAFASPRQMPRYETVVIQISDTITAASVVVAAAGLLFAMRQGNVLKRKEYTDRIRNAASETTAALDRWKELCLRFYDDVEPLVPSGEQPAACTGRLTHHARELSARSDASASSRMRPSSAAPSNPSSPIAPPW